MSTPLLHPTLGVSIGIWRDERVLVVQRGKEPLLGKWSFPGGRVEMGETLVQAALREAKEETAIIADTPRFVEFIELFAHDKRKRPVRHVVLALFAARWQSGTVEAADDVTAANFVTMRELMSLDITPGLEGYARKTFERLNVTAAP